jgi:DNA repair photolyase
MYGFIDYTFNTVKGACSHNCQYCYMKKWGEQKPIRFDEKEMKTDLGENHYIFIGSSCDLFAEDIPADWITKTLTKANQYKNNYLVQSKNPGRFLDFMGLMNPEKYIFCTTLETNAYLPEIMGNSPKPADRVSEMAKFTGHYQAMVTVEPIMDFSLKDFLYMIMCCNPFQVNIGADSGHNRLSEPSGEKIKLLVDILSRYTKVYLKPNLERLIKE